MPKISIIVPVYKAENYIHRCLDSIVSQTFTDWECLLIDDGSPDNSGRICDEYAEKDSRFRVFHKENGGVSSARNMGLDEAQGDWVYFVDSDDWLEEDALQPFLSSIEETIVMIMFGYAKYSEDFVCEYKLGLDKSENRSIESILKEMYKPTDYDYQGYLWCKFFKNSIIKNSKIYFDNSIHYNEDRLFIVNYLVHCSGSVSYNTKSIYNYVVRKDSAMGRLNKKYDPRFVTDFDAFVKMYHLVLSYNCSNELINLAVEGVISSYNSNHSYMEKTNSYDTQAHRYLLRSMRTNHMMRYYWKSLLKRFFGGICRVYLPKLVVRFNK